MKKTIAPLMFALAVATLSAPATAQFQRPDDAVKYRQAVFTTMSHHAARIGAMANGRVPFDAEMAANSAAAVEILSKLPWEGFVAGADKGASRAKPEVWTEPAKFKEGAERLQAATSQLAAAAKTGNLDSVKTAFGEVDQSCRACHRVYRNR